MGGLIAFGLSFFLIWFLKISNFEGGSGYFALFVILTGVAGGFFVGLLTYSPCAPASSKCNCARRRLCWHSRPLRDHRRAEQGFRGQGPKARRRQHPAPRWS